MLTLVLVVSVLLSARLALASLRPEQAQARATIVRVFGTRAPAALRVAWCESRLTPSAVGGANVGLFQVNYVHHWPGESWAAFVLRLSDARANALVAFRLSSGGRDWTAWACRP